MDTLKVGTVLRGGVYDYEIERVLGQGAFGITYLAAIRIRGPLGTLDGGVQVAVKEFFMRKLNGRQGTAVVTGSEGGLCEDYKRKFKREAVNLSKLKHPNIVRVLEAFEANNTAYYAMEYVEGESLDAYIGRKGGLGEEEAVACAREIGAALAFMHGRGMLHLDLKPLNVMRSREGRMILIDFGLAKQYDEKGEPESSSEVGGGTPGYAPVEQANYHEGKDFPVTMDVYALGATLYKMLTGERPAEASEVLNEGLDTEKLRACGVSERVIACVERAMAPMKRQRYQSVGEFIEALTGEKVDEDGEDTVTEETFVYRPYPNTGSVLVEYWPGMPGRNGGRGAYRTRITPRGICYNVTQESTQPDGSFDEPRWRRFLDDLARLPLRVREVEKPYRPSEHSETPPRFEIKFYDEEGSLYGSVWTRGWKSGEAGNLVAGAEELNRKMQAIVPGLRDYLNGPYYEVPRVERVVRKQEKPVSKPMSRGAQTAVYGVAVVASAVIGLAWFVSSLGGVNFVTIAMAIVASLAAAYFFVHAAELRERWWLWLLVLVPLSLVVNEAVRWFFGGFSFQSVLAWWVVDVVAMVAALRFASPLGRGLSEKKKWRWCLLALIPVAYLLNAFLGGSGGEVLLPIFEAILIVVLLPLTFRMKDWALRAMAVACLVVMVICLYIIAYMIYIYGDMIYN